MKFAYFTTHPGKNPPPQNGCRLKSLFFLKHWFQILHFPNSTGIFTKPTGRHYTKYRFSQDIARDLPFLRGDFPFFWHVEGGISHVFGTSNDICVQKYGKEFKYTVS
jgi:hypothetical protein